MSRKTLVALAPGPMPPAVVLSENVRAAPAASLNEAALALVCLRRTARRLMQGDVFPLEPLACYATGSALPFRSSEDPFEAVS